MSAAQIAKVLAARDPRVGSAGVRCGTCLARLDYRFELDAGAVEALFERDATSKSSSSRTPTSTTQRASSRSPAANLGSPVISRATSAPLLAGIRRASARPLSTDPPLRRTDRGVLRPRAQGRCTSSLRVARSPMDLRQYPIDLRRKRKPRPEQREVDRRSRLWLGAFEGEASSLRRRPSSRSSTARAARLRCAQGLERVDQAVAPPRRATDTRRRADRARPAERSGGRKGGGRRRSGYDSDLRRYRATANGCACALCAPGGRGWRSHGIGDSVNASNVSRRKIGDAEFQHATEKTVVAYESHAGRLTDVYVDGHVETLRRVIPLAPKSGNVSRPAVSGISRCASLPTKSTPKIVKSRSTDFASRILAIPFADFCDDRPMARRCSRPITST